MPAAGSMVAVPTCTSICSLSSAFFTTDAPLANFLPNSLLASLSLTPNKSKPLIVVTVFFLLRVLRSKTTCTKGKQVG
jgi:hypothetical protein